VARIRINLIKPDKRIAVYRGLAGKYNREKEGLFKDIEFYSTSKYQAQTFAGEEGQIVRRDIDLKKYRVKEFPTRIRRDGTIDFNKVEFDIIAKSLLPGEILRASKVVDVGPRVSDKLDPKKLWSYGADIYAIRKRRRIKH
jgi:hypothetical protein